MHINEQKLKSKGWTQEEINHTKSALLKATQERAPVYWMKSFEHIGLWLFFIFIIGGAIIGAWLIKPFLIVLNETGALVVICILGLFYGSLASFLAKDIENIQKQHHILVSLCVPISAIITSIIISKQAAIVVQIIKTGVQHNPITLGITFTISSFIPYGIFLILQQRDKHESLRVD